MNNRMYLGGLSILLVFTAFGFLTYAIRQTPPPVTENEVANIDAEVVEEPSLTPPEQEALITVEKPLPNENVTSPLTITGNARGYWYFEASFPVELIDANGVQLAMSPAQAEGEWMTENFVPFIATLTWSSTSTTATSGVLILHRDNPSGLPGNDAEITVPVIF